VTSRVEYYELRRLEMDFWGNGVDVDGSDVVADWETRCCVFVRR
jgi:hypothetical protein